MSSSSGNTSSDGDAAAVAEVQGRQEPAEAGGALGHHTIASSISCHHTLLLIVMVGCCDRGKKPLVTGHKKEAQPYIGMQNFQSLSSKSVV